VVIFLTNLKLLDEARIFFCGSSSELDVLDGLDPLVSGRGEGFTTLDLAFFAEFQVVGSCK